MATKAETERLNVLEESVKLLLQSQNQMMQLLTQQNAAPVESPKTTKTVIISGLEKKAIALVTDWEKHLVNELELSDKAIDNGYVFKHLRFGFLSRDEKHEFTDAVEDSGAAFVTVDKIAPTSQGSFYVVEVMLLKKSKSTPKARSLKDTVEVLKNLPTPYGSYRRS